MEKLKFGHKCKSQLEIEIKVNCCGACGVYAVDILDSERQHVALCSFLCSNCFTIVKENDHVVLSYMTDTW